MDYTQEDLIEAIRIAEDKINAHNSYQRGISDCAALLVEYDQALRGPQSKAELGFTWKTTREFLVKLRRHGFTVSEYLEHCGYEIIKNKRPMVGDVDFMDGAFIASPKGWISTTETNEGVVVAKQLMYLELKMSVIARPKRNNT